MRLANQVRRISHALPDSVDMVEGDVDEGVQVRRTTRELLIVNASGFRALSRADSEHAVS